MEETGGKDVPQTDLTQYNEGDRRPDGEAAAVAGNGGNDTAIVAPEDSRFPTAEDHLKLGVTQVDYTIEGRGDDEHPVVHIFGRTPEGTAEHVQVFGFRPYFYAPSDSLNGRPERAFDRLTGSEETDEDGEPYVSIRGKRLTKIFGQTPRDVGQIRDEFDHYEADILFPNRLLIDKDITSGVRVPARRANDGTIRIPHEEIEAVELEIVPRVCTFDIEVDDRSGFPEDGEEPIICLASHDSYHDEYIGWLFDAPDGEIPPPAAVADHDLLDDDATVEIRTFDTEEGMLDSFVDYINDYNIDLMTGWNFEDFDAPYLVARLEELGLNADRLSRVDEVWDSGWGGPNIKGRVVFDLLYAYKRTQFTELESYRLDAVAEEELGVGKERYAGDIGDLWEEDPERLLEYNLRDVELCVELDRKQDIIAFWEEVASFVGCKLEDATTPGDAVDMYVLHKVHGDFALPSKGTHEGEEYEGGAVFDPISGVKEMVSVLDLASLYPMAMTTINASPETKVGEDYSGDTYHAPNGTEFRKEPDGIIREMVDELLNERERKKTRRDEYDPTRDEYERFDRQQSAVKVIMNCFTPDTEVLTPDGIRGITTLEVGDEVYSLDPETMEMEVKPVVETHAYPEYRGELVDIETTTIDFRVTPNHRMLVRANDQNGRIEHEWSFVEADELSDVRHYELPHRWSFNHSDGLPDRLDLFELAQEAPSSWSTVADGGRKVATQAGVSSVSRDVDTEMFLEFLAWYITGGDGHPADTAPYHIIIREDTDDDWARLEQLLDRLVGSYSENGRAVSFSSPIWHDVLTTHCGGKATSKRIPDLVFQASYQQKRTFLETLLSADQDPSVHSWRFSTPNEHLRDDLIRLCAHLGLTARYTHESGTWRIDITDGATNSFQLNRSGSRSTAEDGVYCVTVSDNNTLLAGRNGKFQWVGNSLYGVLGWDRFRLYDKEMGAAVTATGREVIKFTEEAANEIDKKVVYGDTDSVMLELGGQVSKEDAIEQSFEIEDHINDRYDEFALDELNAHAHRFQIEFEKLYRRFFQAGKKKRYAGHIVWKEGKDVDDIDITGFEYKRSDIAPITKEVQHEVIEMIVTGVDLDEVKTYVHDVIQNFQKGTLDLDRVGIPGGIGKRLGDYDTDTAQVRGAKYANLLLGTNFQRGSKPKRLYLEKVHPAFFRRIESEHPELREDPVYLEFKRDPDVICFEFADQIPDEFEVDWEKMLDKTLKGPIARVLEALDISWQEVKSGQEQTGLGQYT